MRTPNPRPQRLSTKPGAQRDCRRNVWPHQESHRWAWWVLLGLPAPFAVNLFADDFGQDVPSTTLPGLNINFTQIVAAM